MPKALAILGFSLIAATAPAALGGPATEAWFFDELGRRAYADKRYEQAFEAFVLVQEIAPSQRALYNVAVCAELAGHDEAAFAHYREYLASGEDTDGERRRSAAERAQRLEARLALIEVTSEPEGAAIYVERKELGQHGVTPRTIVVAPGEQRLVVELAGYRPALVSVVAETGSPKRVRAALEPRLGRLLVDVVPAAAKIEFFRGEQPVAARRVGDQYELPAGQFAALASAPGHSSARGLVIVHENEVAHLTLGLAPLPKATGRLLVSSGKTSAEVFVDGRRMAVTPATLPDLGVGTHAIEIRAGSRSVHRQVVIEKDRSTYIEVELGSVGRPRR